MIEKVGHVKNPLTIIAIFAGIAEISGTMVLPLLVDSVQAQYVLFLMGFPVLIVILFFLTLLWRPHVLYAPSDYKSEDNFMRTIRRATNQEVLAKQIAEVEEIVEGKKIEIGSAKEGDVEGNTGNKHGEADVTSDVTITPTEFTIATNINNSSVDINSSDSKKLSDAMSDIRSKASLAQTLALSRLEAIYPRLESNVYIEGKFGGHIILDAVLNEHNTRRIYEVKYVGILRASRMRSLTRSFLDQLELKVGIVPSNENRITMVFVTEHDLTNEDKLNYNYSKQFVDIVIYEYKDLLAEEYIAGVRSIHGRHIRS
ncbi:hypothetical protein [Brucella anthropi]|uniref:hypothetical protein n=1 Tax=Brucella anthropi TaxID=529 RepID=UPI00178C4640|nr:hypothetical protein [Brucella anthropi]